MPSDHADQQERSCRDGLANWYAVLGVGVTASAADIKAAYRRRARHTHSDLTGGDGTAFAQVAHAFEVLGDPARRAAYDADLRAAGRYHDGTIEVYVPTPRPPGSRFVSTPRPSRPAPAPAVGPSIRFGRWFAVALVAIVAGNMARFSGVPADVFGFAYGTDMLVGGQWTGVPRVNAGVDFSTAVALAVWGLVVAVLASAAALVWWWRRAVRPVPVVEQVAVVAALAVTSSAWEVLLVRHQFWQVAAAALALWGSWVLWLRRSPRPATAAAWDSWSVWRAQRRAKTVDEEGTCGDGSPTSVETV